MDDPTSVSTLSQIFALLTIQQKQNVEIASMLSTIVNNQIEILSVIKNENMDAVAKKVLDSELYYRNKRYSEAVKIFASSIPSVSSFLSHVAENNPNQMEDK